MNHKGEITYETRKNDPRRHEYAGNDAAGAENALVETVQQQTILVGLEILNLVVGVHLALLLEPGLDGSVLLVEVGHIRDQILNHVHMGKRTHRGDLGILGNFCQAGQTVLAVDVHSTTRNGGGVNYNQGLVLFNFDKYTDYSYDPRIIDGKGKIKVIEAFSPEYEFELNITSKDGALVQMPLIYYPGYKVTVIDNVIGEKEVIKPEMVEGFVGFSLEKGNYTVSTDFVGSTLRQISVAYTIISVTATLGLLAYAIYFENKRKKEDEDKTC